jgi:CheY-like chemotaxis protein
MPLPARPSILLVEDDPALKRLVRRRAEREGLAVVEAGTCADGLASAITEQPKLILTDMHLPDGTGLRLLGNLKADPRTRDIPVVVWSASGAERNVDAIEAGAVAYFEKTDIKALVCTLVELLQRSAANRG